MFPKFARLSKKKDFDRLQQQGRTVFGPLFNIKYLPNGLEHPRLTVVVGKKIHLRANQRNLIKRRLRAALRENNDLLKGFDLAIYAKKEIKTADFTTIKQHLEQSLKRLRRF